MDGTGPNVDKGTVPEADRTWTSPKKHPGTTLNGSFDNASSGDSGPRKSNHVNGIAKKFDYVNGVNSDAGSQSLADTSDDLGRKQPPKLKRKAPG